MHEYRPSQGQERWQHQELQAVPDPGQDGQARHLSFSWVTAFPKDIAASMLGHASYLEVEWPGDAVG